MTTSDSRKMFNTPILFLIFNRPETTAPVFEQIKKLRPKYLYVAADGPRDNKPGEAEECSAARAIVLEGIDWDCEVKTFLRAENAGCRKAVSEAIAWFFEQEEQGIILEDDCLPHQSFFPYCEQLLIRYKHDSTVISIGGTNLGYDFENDDSYGFSRFMNMWGWATWRRSVQLVDYDMNRWKKMTFKKLFLFSRLKNKQAIDINWINYWKNYFDITASGKLNTWDYQWIFAQLYHKKISIFPSHNLVKNIGFTDKATHTAYPDHPIAGLPLQVLELPLKHPVNNLVNAVYEESYLKKIWFGHHRESVYAIVKTKLLYIPIIAKANHYLKNRSRN